MFFLQVYRNNLLSIIEEILQYNNKYYHRRLNYWKILSVTPTVAIVELNKDNVLNFKEMGEPGNRIDQFSPQRNRTMKFISKKTSIFWRSDRTPGYEVITMWIFRIPNMLAGVISIKVSNLIIKATLDQNWPSRTKQNPRLQE